MLVVNFMILLCFLFLLLFFCFFSTLDLFWVIRPFLGYAFKSFSKARRDSIKPNKIIRILTAINKKKTGMFDLERRQ